ncbi:SDR family NAD(P)-dependent oxidoreductase [Paraburkholderia atlantica]|uniref:SDR family NAD(P)-dependent oxidoreductase n=1 Tax=Paraburkholderia atlantica TaxID=2654982 RepID=UPI003D2632A3
MNPSGVEALTLACGIGGSESVRGAVSNVEARLGIADVLVNDAGLLRRGGIEEIGLDAWNAMLRVNLTGYMLCSQHFGQRMLKRGTGALVHVASVRRQPRLDWGLAGTPPGNAYGAAKTGIVAMTGSLACECARDRIRPSARTSRRNRQRDRLSRSDAASYITGTVLSVEGPGDQAIRTTRKTPLHLKET